MNGNVDCNVSRGFDRIHSLVVQDALNRINGICLQ